MTEDEFLELTYKKAEKKPNGRTTYCLH